MGNSVAKQPPAKRVTIEEYFRLDDASVEKLEYDDGEIVAMAGTTLEHARISANLIGELSNRLRGKSCQAFGSDLRVSVPELPSYSYPDISVVCGKPEIDPRDSSGLRSVTNPRVLIEILSQTTEASDRGRKFLRYIQLASLQQYVLISQREPRVEFFSRTDDGNWVFSHVEGLGAIAKLTSIEIELPLSEIFRNVVFPTQAEIDAEDESNGEIPANPTA